MNLFLCGEFENAPVAMKIVNSDKTLISDVKSKLSKTINIQEEGLILYFSDSILPDDTPLSHWKGMRSGAAVLVGANPLIVTLQRYNSDIDVKFEIPRLAAPRWPTQSLLDLCQYKGGLPNRNDGKYVFAVDGEVIAGENSKVSDYDSLRDNFTITVTFLQKAFYKTVLGYDPNSRSCTCRTYVPLNVSNSCIEKALLVDSEGKLDAAVVVHAQMTRNDDDSRESGYIHFKKASQNEISNIKRVSFVCWKLFVQRMNGTKDLVSLSNHCLTSVYELRQQISPDANIRLTFGTTILEDWDDEGNMMLLCHYPDLHDGATLCQINLTEAVKIPLKMDVHQVAPNLKPHNDSVIDEDFDLKVPKFIYIENPHQFTITRFINILKNLNYIKCNTDCVNVYKSVPNTWSSYHSSEILMPSDDPIGPLISEYNMTGSYSNFRFSCEYNSVTILYY